jgi:hypothetical protein
MRRFLSILAVPAVLLAGCYHATIQTGQPASSEVISNQWAPGWIFGLVPPSTVETAAKCKNGVAKVETQLSFLNQLVSFITFSIFTPMQIDVTCASSSRVGALPAGAATVAVRDNMTAAEMEHAIGVAAEIARSTHQAVYLTR